MAENVLKAIKVGTLTFGGVAVPCAVLENEMRVLTQKGFLETLGRSSNVGRSGRAEGGASLDLDIRTTWGAKNLQAFSDKASSLRTTPVRFKLPNGAEAIGYDAELLPEVCEIYVRAQLAEALTHSQRHIARRCQVILLAFAKTGIKALVDEATGYKKKPLEYQEFVELMLAKELMPWVKRFPDEFFEGIANLKGWRYTTGPVGLPRVVGHYINRFVYNLLPTEVRAELERLAAEEHDARMHQGLSENFGVKWLDTHLTRVITMLQTAISWSQFQWMFKRMFPKAGAQQEWWLGPTGTED